MAPKFAIFCENILGLRLWLGLELSLGLGLGLRLGLG